MRKLCIAIALLLAVWGLTRTREPGRAHILRFYASTGAASPGQSVRLCYAVENARTVRISPLVSGSYPARDYCLEVAPEHTTHFTLMAEGYDGSVDTRSFTLPVQTITPVLPRSTPPAIASL
ncbi:MAG TPA: hypothetical protein VKE70_18700 [Candidatus Solibacter sp.]|nr:hypothetical protein [Candidatus Solibacter sp.]